MGDLVDLTEEEYEQLAKNIVFGFLFSSKQRGTISLDNYGKLSLDYLSNNVIAELKKRDRGDVLVCSGYKGDEETHNVDVNSLVRQYINKS